MARPQQSFDKSEKEKKRKKKRQEKAERREQRRLEKAQKGKLSFEEQLSYLDEDGNLTTTPPDPTKKKKEVKIEEIQLGVPSRSNPEEEKFRKGKVNFFNTTKGFGFISEKNSLESIFFHINNAEDPIKEGDYVIFEVEKGPKGLSAINVRLD